MSRPSTSRRLVALTALLAVLAASMLPAVAHAFRLGDASTEWATVCSASGTAAIEVPADGPGLPEAPKASNLEHCPFCSIQAALPAILPAEMGIAATPDASGPVLPLYLVVPRLPLAWLSAPPRAPPLTA